MAIQQGPYTSGRPSVDGFIERALIDFGLMEAFKLRSIEECALSLSLIAAAEDAEEEEERVSQLLECLASGAALPS